MSPPSQTQIFGDSSDIVDPFKGVLLDAYGVFWAGNNSGVFPGSKEAMEKLVSAKKTVGILSNSTQLASKEINKLQKHGLMQGKHFHFLLTSGEVAKQVFTKGQLPFKTPGNKFWIFGDIHPRFSSPLTLFENSSYEETKELSSADFIYISIPHIDGEDQIHPNVFLDKIKKLRATKLPMVCANPDRFAHEGTPPKAVVRQGSIARLYEEVGGRVFYIGKPYSIVYEVAMELFQETGISRPEEILMIGDTPETDIRGANNFKMPSALTIETGIMADRIKEQELNIDNLQLPLRDQPNFIIKRL